MGKVKQGVQGGVVVSPMLFNIYMSKLPQPPKDINITSYADDITLTSSHARVEKFRDITPYLNTLHDWLESREFKLSAEKSSATVFTTWSIEVKFDSHLTIKNSPKPVKSKVKVLGVTFDSMLNFGEHVRSTKEKFQKRNNILKKIAGSDWGCTKETLSLTYKAIGRSVLNHGAPIWASTISNTNRNHLQLQQIISFRTITACVKMSDINDLHNEGEMLPFKAHTEMLAEQFLAGSYQSHRADHETTSSTSLRPIRPTLNDTYRDLVKQGTKNKEQLNRKEYKNALKSIHRHTVHTPLNNDRKQLSTLPKGSRRSTNVATNCTYPTSATENWILPPAKLLREYDL